MPTENTLNPYFRETDQDVKRFLVIFLGSNVN